MLTKRKRFNEGLILAQSFSQSLLASISVRKKSRAGTLGFSVMQQFDGSDQVDAHVAVSHFLAFANHSSLSFGNVAHARFFRSALRATPLMIPIICVIERSDLSAGRDQPAQFMNASHSWITARRASRSGFVTLLCLLPGRIVISSRLA
jgi:hypothetical protein